MSQLPEGVSAAAVVDLDAIRANVVTLRTAAPTADMMAVVKADGYGHGMVPAARAALEAGATWLGVATLQEALTLRAAGITAPCLAWLTGPGEDLAAAIAADVDLSAGAPWMLDEIVRGARSAGRPARVHLKVDTGLHRGGALDWPGLVAGAAGAESDGALQVVGVFSHLACADAPGHPTIDAQAGVFSEALEVARRAGLTPQFRHLANSAATLTRPDLHFDLVRPGASVFGLSPSPQVGTASALRLRPAMTLAARAILVKDVRAGAGVSYGHRYHTPADTTLALVPLGYADGVPRGATGVAEVLVGASRCPIAGTVCMDQFVVDLGGRRPDAAAGDDVVLFGPGDAGEPTADEWAGWLDTINYEIVTRVGARVPRHYVGKPV